MRKNRFQTSWMLNHINDPYVKLAQQEGYRARAAYKLKEIDEADNLIKPGAIIVDLGAAPGSWSQYARNRLSELNRKTLSSNHFNSGHHLLPEKDTKKNFGFIIALDILPMEKVADVDFIYGDFREIEVCNQLYSKLSGRKVDLVISDMAPNLSGVAAADSSRISHLCELALEFSLQVLNKDGILLVKSFYGSGHSQTVEYFKKYFKKVMPRKPKASRDKSSEVFLLAKELKNTSI